MQVVIFVPGFFGSALAYVDKEVWPPTPLEVLRGYERIDDLMRPGLRVTGIVENTCVDLYGDLIRALNGIGFTEDGETHRLVKHAYDWRRDILELADDLDALLCEQVDIYGAKVEITLICHALGGLVARACLERIAKKAKPWTQAVKLVVFLATPHKGMPLAFARITGIGGSSLGLSSEQLKQLAAVDGLPASYQSLPLIEQQVVWDLDGDDARITGRSAFDAEIAAGLLAVHLAAADDLDKALDPSRRAGGIRYFSIGSAAHRTLTRFDRRDGVFIPVYDKNFGDGVVPISSAFALPGQCILVEANHVTITRKATTHEILARLLGLPPASPPHANGNADTLHLSLSHSVIAEGEDYEVVVTRRAGLTPSPELSATLNIYRDTKDDGFVSDRSLAVSAVADGLERISLQGPPLASGSYRFELVSDDGGEIRLHEDEALLVTRRDGPYANDGR